MLSSMRALSGGLYRYIQYFTNFVFNIMKHFTLYNLIIAFIAITTISCTKETIQEDTDIIKDTTKRNFFELSQESISLEKREKQSA